MPSETEAAALLGGRPHPWVVVGVDRSPSAIGALRWAADHCRVTGGSLLAVTACPGATLSFVELPEAVGAQERKAAEAQRAAQAELDAVVRDVLGDQADEVVRAVVLGGVADTLLDVSSDADLLVIGTTTRGRLGRALLGSVRPTRLARARCPVVLVPADEDAEHGGPADG